MKNSLLFVSIFTIFILCSCSQQNETISGNDRKLEEEIEMLKEINKEQEDKIERITTINTELRNEINSFKQEKEYFVFISNLARDFVRAHNSGDKGRLQELLSEEMVLVEKENWLYVKHNDDSYEWLLHNPEGEAVFDGWVLQGFEYNPTEETYMVHIREFYTNRNGKPVSPPSFINLTFKKMGDEWKVIKLSFDV